MKTKKQASTQKQLAPELSVSALKKEILRLQRQLEKSQLQNLTLKNKLAIYAPIVADAQKRKAAEEAMDEETDQALRDALA